MLAKRFALEGYIVYTIDLPQQNGSHGRWEMGVMCDFITESVEMLRSKFGAKYVSVMGHSAGSIASLFSSLKYNTYIEKLVMKRFEEFITLSKELEHIPENEQEHVLMQLEELRRKIFSVINLSFKRGGEEYGKIDSFVLVSPPDKFQNVFPPQVAGWLGAKKQSRVKKVLDIAINLGMRNNLLGSKDTSVYQGSDPHSKDAEFYHLRIPELKKFLDYIGSMTNPCDYANLLLHFSGESPEIKSFLEQRLYTQPKLFLYGKWDALLKGFALSKLKKSPGLTISDARKAELDSVYAMFGNHRIVTLSDLSHFMNEGDKLSINLRNQQVNDKRVTAEILNFLKQTNIVPQQEQKHAA